MAGECVFCEWLDQESVKRWEKALEKGWADKGDNEIPLLPEFIQFDSRRAHCTEPRNRRQPVTDPVAGTHLDGPPWLRCQEVRRLYPICPDWKERHEGQDNQDGAAQENR